MVNKGARNIHQLKETNPQQLFFLDYKDLIDDPLKQTKNIYKHFNLKLTNETEEAMKQFTKNDPKKSHGTHKYNLSDFSLSLDDLKVEFKEYLDIMAKILPGKRLF